ncbi:MAG: hypothetical protein Q9167_003823 [Letrouitia subvulpina]
MTIVLRTARFTTKWAPIRLFRATPFKRHYATPTSADPEIYDVVCVGGGPVGLGLLTALRELLIGLVQSENNLERARTWHLPSNTYSNRASSLTPSTVSFLSHVKVWEQVDTSRVQPYHHMRVWDGLDDSSAIFFSGHENPVAQMTENQNLTRALLSRLDCLRPVSFFDNTKVSSIELGPSPLSPVSLDLSSYPFVTLASGQILAARLLVGADGLNSPVRSFAGIPSRGWDYDCHGVVATLKHAPRDLYDDQSHRAIAYQRFLPSGPIALLPLPDDFATLVWSTTPTMAAQLNSLAPEDFVAMVNSAFRLSNVDLQFMCSQQSGQVNELAWRTRVTGVREDEKLYPRLILSAEANSVASFPLRYRQADSYISSRLALIGDAAHTIHPLAGQGLNMGFADVQSLAKAIEYTIAHGGDIGAEINLEQYNNDMWIQNNRMLGVTDKLHKLYGVGWGPLVGLRGLGLRIVDRLGPFKEFLMRQAGGANG